MDMQNDFEQRLHHALTHEEIFPYLQPIVDVSTQMIVGYEALARWIDVTHGFVPCNTFIPLLEKDGRITQLDLSIFKQICHLIQTCKQHNFDLVRISCNFSRSNFMDANFSKKIQTLMNTYDIHSRQVAVEVTESVQIEKSNIVNRNIQHLHELGIPLHIDDFGKGYTSYKDFDHYKADSFKIDKSLLAHSENTEAGKYLISLIKLGRQRGMNIISEGVENKAQADFLLKHDCDFAQGFYYYPPMPAREALGLLSKI